MSTKASYVKPILLNTNEAADYLGINRKTVIKLAEEGQIPALRIGKLYKFNLFELERFIFENTTNVKKTIIRPNETVTVYE